MRSCNPGRVRHRLTAVTAAVGLVTGVAAVPAAAQQTGESGEDAMAPVMLVLDASESMTDPDPGGRSKMDAAKSVLIDMLEQLPDEAEVGLIVYGSEVDAAEGPELSCEDIATAFPVGPLDREAMTSAVADIEARGWTPIGGSLRAAADGLPGEEPRSILLISDGAETCAPPEACDVAEDLEQAGTKLTMHTIGFDVTTDARRELECIAEAGNGEYVEAPDAEALDDELPRLTESALRSYEASGIPVTGTEAVDDAPALLPGQYVDSVNSDATRYYGLRVPEGMAAHVAATLIRPSDEGAGGTAASYLDAKLVDRDHDQCDSDRSIDSDMTWNAHNTASVSMRAGSGGSCSSEDGHYYLRVERGSSERALGERDLEILVAFEPPTSEDHGPSPEGIDEPDDLPGEPERLPGGGSFNVATELADSGTYVDELHYGEAIFYRVPLEWGQGLAYQVTLGDTAGPSLDTTANITTELYNPVRDNSDVATRNSTAYTGNVLDLDVIAIPTVYAGNRSLRGAPGMAALAGDYYIVVQLNPSGGDVGPVDMTLALQIYGDPADPPAYTSIDHYPATLMYDGAGLTDGGEASDGTGSVAEAESGHQRSEHSTSGSRVELLSDARVLGAAGTFVVLLAGTIGGIWWWARRLPAGG
ncbi:VWA domain-containing protein [Haloechinothrix sp. LS1_15]|uniref:vWA domain-containing protein n=1 Tax=Haloechinothrix sp. LS1_15 TaxID=2652248 RepID=UPI0029487AAF|nr:VWA domain-containing protein [Haloechinothrix sp. LS1_15]MDV6012184.1 VWA domain-containing protein [Haloechinothrix sp. LS1_15]